MRDFGMHDTDFDAVRRSRARRAALVCAALFALLAGGAGAPAALAQDTEAPRDSDALEDPAPEVGTSEGDGTDPTATGTGSITINADRTRIKLGQSISFSGRRKPAQGGERVNLKFKRPGGTYRRVARTRTDARGRYTVSAKPRRNGNFVVTSPRQSGKALRSRRQEVGVHARVEAEGRRHQLRDRGVRVSGKVRPMDSGRRVVLQRQTGKGWQRLKATRTGARGQYSFRWDPPSLGGYKLRARFGGDELNRGARGALGHRVNVYRKDHASYYGPGFYGNTTACGQTLRRGTVGVAHKRIRCGAKIRFHYRGTTRRITVIDRGPYIAGRRWDLTNAARKRLGFPRGTDDIWANR